MESKNSSLAILHEPFVAGMDENLSPIMQRLWKLEGGAIRKRKTDNQRRKGIGSGFRFYFVEYAVCKWDIPVICLWW